MRTCDLDDVRIHYREEGAPGGPFSYVWTERLQALWDGLKKEADKNSDELISLEEWVQIIKGTDPRLVHANA